MSLKVRAVTKMYKNLSWRENVGHEEFYVTSRLAELRVEMKVLRERQTWLRTSIDAYDYNLTP